MDRSLRHRWAVIGGLSALVVLGIALLVVADHEDQEIEAAQDPTTTESTTTTAPEPTTTTPPVTTTTSAPPTTTTTAPPATTTTRPPSTTTAPPAPPYRSSVAAVTAADLGSSYTPGLGCAAPSELRAVTVTHWGDDGAVHTGTLVVHGSQAANVRAIFGDVYAARFPIAQIVPVDRYGGDDDASMRANNTSAYNCRTVAGTNTLSNHAFGRAIDVNPLQNPYVKGSSVDPPEGAAWADRSNRRPGMIFGGDAVVTAFGARGWSWGGNWNSGQDHQHFDT